MTTPTLLFWALLLDALFGEPDWLWTRLPHPAVLMGRLIGKTDSLFNSGRARRVKGALCVAMLVLVGISVGLLLQTLGSAVQICVAAVLLAQRSLIEHVSDVAVGLRRDLASGRAAVAMIVSRDTGAMDASQTARAAIESAAENLSDGVIAPAFWFMVAGLPGILTYKLINTADSMIGYRTPRHADFGWAAARTDDVLNLMPARLTAVLITLAAGVFEGRAIRADAKRHRSPNAGWPEAAMARALGVALAGPRAYHGEMRAFDWVNPSGRRTLSAMDIDASIAMLWKAWGLLIGLCATLMLIF